MRITIFSILTVLVAVLTAPTVLAQESPQCEFEYTVQAGDSLSAIAEKYFGGTAAFQAIVEAANALPEDAYSDIADPNIIVPGWTLCIPADGNPVTGPSTAPAKLVGTTWQWEEFQDTAGINDITVPNPENYTLTLNSDGTFNGQADCNGISGEYSLESSSLTLAPGPMTMAICSPESLSNQYVALLGEVISYVQNEGKLYLNLKLDSGNMVFNPQGGASGLSPEALKNMQVQTEWTANGTAQLENGFYSEPGPPGANFGTSVRLVEEFTAGGQLNGQDAVAVVLEIMLSGTGTLYDLAVVVDQNGTPVNIATINLGNRVKINSVAIGNNEVVVDMVTQGETDHPCCPSQQVVRRYTLEGNQLVQTGEELLGPVILPADLSPETLENMTYLSTWTISGTATLVNGEYREPAAPGSATETVITFDNRSSTVGEIDGRQSTAVFLRVDPGGSGTFIDLAVVSDVDGQPVNVAVTTLGDRVQIIDHKIIEGQVEVNLLTHAQEQPLNESPGEQFIRRYAVQGAELVQVSESYLGRYPGVYQSRLTVDNVTFDPQGLAQSVEGSEVPASPYNTCCPPGPVGAPDHLQFTFDGELRLYIYPIQAWEAQWNAAGNDAISRTADQLRSLISEQPTSPLPPLPVLPLPGGFNDISAQVKYLDFGSGSGMRYLGRWRQDMGPATATDFRYVFQGFTGDGQYLVSFSFPLVASALPADFNAVPPETMTQMQEDLDAYRQLVIDTLNAQPATGFEPDLERLDALVGSITIAP